VRLFLLAHGASRLTRRRWRVPAGAAFLTLFVDAPPSLARLRNDARTGPDRVPGQAWDRICAAFEAPSEGRSRSLHVDATSPPAAEQLWNEVLAAWAEAPPMPLPPADVKTAQTAARAATAASRVHAWDLRARKEVAAAVAQGAFSSHQIRSSSQPFPRPAPPNVRAAVAAQYNEVRTRCMATIRAAADEAIEATGAAMLHAFAAARGGATASCSAAAPG